MIVQEVDYPALVAEMAEVGIDKMGEVLAAKIEALGQPKWQNEVKYFWTALFNTARKNDVVWLWLCTAPHIRKFAPAEAEVTVYPQRVSYIPLPDIGGEDDAPFKPTERPKQWSSEPTEENFREQAEALNEFLRAEGEKNPENRCRNIEGYVSTFYHSGTGQMSAQIQLTEAGFHALATREGIDWLLANYPPPKE